MPRTVGTYAPAAGAHLDIAINMPMGGTIEIVNDSIFQLNMDLWGGAAQTFLVPPHIIDGYKLDYFSGLIHILPVGGYSSAVNSPTNSLIINTYGPGEADNRTYPIPLHRVANQSNSIGQLPTTYIFSGGNVFSRSTGWIVAAGAGNFPLCLFNPQNSGKTAYLISILVAASVTYHAQIMALNIDPNYGNFGWNNRGFTGGSVMNPTYATTTQTLPGGNPLVVAAQGANNQIELCSNQAGFWLPASPVQGAGFVSWVIVGGAGNISNTIVWVEF